MKIIVRGKDNRRVTCERCGCIYEYDDDDLEEFPSPLFGVMGLGANVKYVACPECNLAFVVRRNEDNEYGMKAYMEDAKNE